MSVVISVNSTEKNLGVTTVALTLTEKLNYFTKQRVCLLELCRDNSISYILEEEGKPLKNIDNILPFITEYSSVDDEMVNLIKSNTIELNVKDISVIYGSRQFKDIPEHKINIIIKALKQSYDIIVVDLGQHNTGKLKNIQDINLFLMQTSSRFIDTLIYVDNLEDHRNRFIFNKASMDINKYKYKFKETFPDYKLIGHLPIDDKVKIRLSNNNINIEEGNYFKRISGLVLELCEELSIPVKVSTNKITKLLGKLDYREEEVVIKDYKKGNRLGEILVEMNICTEKDIERALKRQVSAKMFDGGNNNA